MIGAAIKAKKQTPAPSRTARTERPTQTVSIATRRNKLVGARCAVCRQHILELDAVATSPTSPRPIHVPCLPKWARQAIGYDETGTDTSQCWYLGCPHRADPRRGHNLCTEHDTLLYGN